jgi:hypothetical protein
LEKTVRYQSKRKLSLGIPSSAKCLKSSGRYWERERDQERSQSEWARERETEGDRERERERQRERERDRETERDRERESNGERETEREQGRERETERETERERDRERDLLKEIIKAFDISIDSWLVEEVHIHVGSVVAQEIGETEEGIVFVHIEKKDSHHVAHALRRRGSQKRQRTRRGPGHSQYPADSRHKLSEHCQEIDSMGHLKAVSLIRWGQEKVWTSDPPSWKNLRVGKVLGRSLSMSAMVDWRSPPSSGVEVSIGERDPGANPCNSSCSWSNLIRLAFSVKSFATSTRLVYWCSSICRDVKRERSREVKRGQERDREGQRDRERGKSERSRAAADL